MRGQHSYRHKELVAELVAEGAQVGGFAKMLRAIDPDVTTSRRPDAWTVDHEEGLVTVYEVEVTHHLNDDSLLAYGWAWFLLDCVDYDLELVRIDRSGKRWKQDLCRAYYQLVIPATLRAWAEEESLA